MPHFFLHLRDHLDEITDPDGVDLPDFEALKKTVVEAARDVMMGDLRNGLVDLRYRIDAEDDQGAVVFSLPFRYAVSIIPE